MEQRGGADEETPDKHLPAIRVETGRVGLQVGAETEQRERELGRDDCVKAVQEDQLGKLVQVADLRVVRREIAAARYPAHVGPPEPVDMGGMGVLGLVGMLVMMPVVVGPPEWPALHRGPAAEGHDELHRPRGAVGLVREVAVVDPRDRGHARQVKEDSRPDSETRWRSCPDDAEAPEVQYDEGDTPDPVDPVRLVAHGVGARGGVVGVEPLDHG